MLRTDVPTRDGIMGGGTRLHRPDSTTSCSSAMAEGARAANTKCPASEHNEQSFFHHDFGHRDADSSPGIISTHVNLMPAKIMLSPLVGLTLSCGWRANAIMRSYVRMFLTCVAGPSWIFEPVLVLNGPDCTLALLCTDSIHLRNVDKWFQCEMPQPVNCLLSLSGLFGVWHRSL